MSTISENLQQIRRDLPEQTTLVAVSKYYPVEAIEEAYAAGQRVFGESRVQELREKAERLPKDIQWHFIGHLQTNKLKMVLPYVSLVQSVDSLRLLESIDSWGRMNDKVINVLLEPHVAAEQTKQGFEKDEISEILADSRRFANISFRGIMGMATFTDDESVIRSDFSNLKDIRDAVIDNFPALSDDFIELSIGMSDDYHIAMEYGSTMVRIGSMIFGSRA